MNVRQGIAKAAVKIGPALRCDLRFQGLGNLPLAAGGLAPVARGLPRAPETPG